MPRHAHIEIDPSAITANTRAVRSVAGSVALCAVVKADGYGHGSVLAARAALTGGAEWLAVALAEEGQVLRAAGIEAPILLLSEPPPDVMPEAYAADLVPTLYTHAGIEAARSCVSGSDYLDGAGGRRGRDPWQVHLKVDTGMHRVGADPEEAVELARLIATSTELELGGTFTHLAVADEPDRPETARQLKLFNSILAEMEAAGIETGVRHAANSAAALRWENARFDMVRVGIAIYGYSPFGSDSPEAKLLRPALALRSEVAMTRTLSAGEGVSYGLRHEFDRDAVVAVVPLGYADGIDRRLGIAGGEVLIRGAGHRIRGVVTMDQLIVEITPGFETRAGDEVTLIGSQDANTITADDWAELLGTIPYEVVCRFSARVPRIESERVPTTTEVVGAAGAMGQGATGQDATGHDATGQGATAERYG